MLSPADSSGNPGRGCPRDILARPRGLSSPHAMLTTDRLGGSALCLLAVFVMWESRRLPLGTWHNPGPGYFPVLLAVILFVLGGLVCAMGTHAAPVATVGWSEARQALVILAVGRLHLPRPRATRLSSSPCWPPCSSWSGSWSGEASSVAVTFALALAAGSFYLFDTLLRVPLPRGPFGI